MLLGGAVSCRVVLDRICGIRAVVGQGRHLIVFCQSAGCTLVHFIEEVLCLPSKIDKPRHPEILWKLKHACKRFYMPASLSCYLIDVTTVSYIVLLVGF